MRKRDSESFIIAFGKQKKKAKENYPGNISQFYKAITSWIEETSGFRPLQS